MLFLILHIIGNAAFLLLVRVGRGRRFDYPVVGFANYATAAALALAGLAQAVLPSLDGRAALLGLVNGMQYQITYLLMFVLLGLAGVAVTTSFMRLSIAVPVLASIAIWGEWPTPIQAIGLGAAAVALPLLSSSTRRPARPAQAAEPANPGQTAQPIGPVSAIESVSPGEPDQPAHDQGTSRLALAGLVGATVAISGCGLLAAKAFAELHVPEQRPVYVLAVYATATALSTLAWPWRARFRVSRQDDPGSAGSHQRAWRSLALGVAVGLLNFGQIWLLLPALATVPGVIAFPVASAGGLSLATLGAWVFWREPLGGRTGAGIALAMLGGALANAH